MSSPNETGWGEIYSANLPFWFLFSSVTYDVFVLAVAMWMSVVTFGDLVWCNLRWKIPPSDIVHIRHRKYALTLSRQ